MSARVITVTLNPALDLTVQLDALQPGRVHRARSARLDAGGKGVNVAACLADWGVACVATGLLGVGNAAAFEALFEAKTIDDRFVRVLGETRTNIKLVDGVRRETTDINLPGIHAQAGDLEAVQQAIVDEGRPGDWLVLSGSVPGGVPDHAYLGLIAAARQRRLRVLLDTSGAPLREALSASGPLLPDVIKPNLAEFEAIGSQALDSAEAVVAAARVQLARGVKLVTVSMGEQGALFVDAQRVLRAKPARIEAGSTVGAGDAMVAGITAALLDGRDLDGIARLGTAFAAAKLERAGAHLPSRERVVALATAVHIEVLQ